MKKKVLTTAAALAMLAPTMTSFASTNVTMGSVSDVDTNTISHDVSISGKSDRKSVV